jgi:hypothetical protein
MLPTHLQLNKALIGALTLMVGAMGPLLCSSRSHAQQEPNREIKVSTDKYRFKFRFNAASPAEAARALEAIRQVCGGK